MSLGKDDILGAQDRPTERVHVPEWNGEVLVRTLSGSERDAFEVVAQKGKDVRASLCAACIVDESGERIFSNDDVKALGAKSSVALDRIFWVALRLNKVSESDVEELEGN